MDAQPNEPMRWRVEVDDEAAFIVETAEDGSDYVIAGGLEWQQANTLASAHNREGWHPSNLGLAEMREAIPDQPLDDEEQCEHADAQGGRCIAVGRHKRASGVIHMYAARPIVIDWEGRL